MKKEYDFSDAQRGRFYRKGAKMILPDRRDVYVGFKATKQVVLALHALIATGLFGDGATVGSVAEELVRRALLDPAVLPYWQTARVRVSAKRRKGKS